jgi:murein DD-endopeptidase MepM/ murein hydrolase activator NlpD
LPQFQGWKTRAALGVAALAIGCGLIGVLRHENSAPGDSLTPQIITADSAAIVALPAVPVKWPQIEKKNVTVRRGETLASVLGDAGIDKDTSYQVVSALKKNFRPQDLSSGQEINFTLERSGPTQKRPTLTEMSMASEIDSRLVVKRKESGSYEAKIESTPVRHVAMHAFGAISDSLFLAAQRQGVPANVITQLIKLYSYDVDFQRGIKEGDRFELYFDRTVSADGKKVKEGDILYANLTLNGASNPLYRYAANNSDGAEYFHENGQSVKRSLMRTPIDGARLTSGYGMRFHPILGYTKMHKGVDFGAPRGTPVMAAGDGVIMKASPFGTYGNYIEIRHNNNYETAYAHLSGYAPGVHAGARVRQGQVIGYVGTTGRSTGPHLHYEVLLANRQVNPQGLKIPTGTTLGGKTLVAFKSYMKGLNREVASAPTGVMLARN